MKRYIRSTKVKERLQPFRFGVISSETKDKYVAKGQIDEVGGYFFGQVVKVAAYDDADYWWARVNGGGLIELIYEGKVRDTIEHSFDEDSYETVKEYLDDMIDVAVEELDIKNKSIQPTMVHN